MRVDQPRHQHPPAKVDALGGVAGGQALRYLADDGARNQHPHPAPSFTMPRVEHEAVVSQGHRQGASRPN